MKSNDYTDVVIPIFHSGVLYRGQNFNDVFLRRTGCILGHLLMTYHSDEDKEPTKQWKITMNSEIEPILKHKIRVADDQWTALGARIFSKTHIVEAYITRLSWPENDSANYNSILLAFDSEDSAFEWRDIILKLIKIGKRQQSSYLLKKSNYGSELLSESEHKALNIPVDDKSQETVYKDQWYPIKELDGMVVYYKEDNNGGAYMVSSLIRANPVDCLEALTTGSFLFGCGDLCLHPTGLGSWFLSPRELYIQRIQKQYSDGTVCLAFKSCDQHYSKQEISSSWSWFSTPVKANIPAAGFTISAVHSINKRVDSMLNFVLQIDLGGICSSKGIFKVALDAFGICEEWIDRILMTVRNLKQRLETNAIKLNDCLSKQHSLQSVNNGCSSARNIYAFRGSSSMISRSGSVPFPTNGMFHTKFWRDPGNEGFVIRGDNYLNDKRKIPAEDPRFKLDWVYLLKLKAPLNDIAKFLPALRSGPDDFTFVLHVLVPGPPCLSVVMGWTPTQLTRCTSETNISDLSASSENKDPFDVCFQRFLDSDDETRDGMFKLIPKVVEGSYVVRRSVGSVPVLIGRRLKQTYYKGTGYFEVDLDISSSMIATSVIRLVQSVTKNFTVDLAILFEGSKPEELPEALLGTVRLDHVDFGAAVPFEDIVRRV